MAYIIGSYNKYDKWDRAHSVYTFYLNNAPYAIKLVELEWGLPSLPISVIFENDPHTYHLYESYEDAFHFVSQLKHLNT